MQVCTSSRSARTSGCSTTNSTVEKEWVRSFWGSTLAAHITKFPNSEKSQIIISGFTICKHQGSFKNIHISFTAGRFGGTACGSARRRRRRWWPSRRWRPKLGFAFTTSSPPGRWFQLISPKVTWLSFYCLLVAQPQMCLENFWTEIPVYSHVPTTKVMEKYPLNDFRVGVLTRLQVSYPFKHVQIPHWDLNWNQFHKSTSK